MECLRCGGQASQGKAMCDTCLAIPRHIPLMPSQMPQLETPKNKPWHLLGIIPLVILAFIFLRSGKPTPFKGVQLQTLNGGKSELCENRKGCIAIFLAPWCASCQSEVGFVNNLVAASKQTDLGIEVIVGWDDKQELQKFGQSFKGKVYLDSDNAFRSKLSFSSVPRWFAVNSQQEVTKSFFPSSYQGETPLEQLKYIVNNYVSELKELVVK